MDKYFKKKKVLIPWLQLNQNLKKWSVQPLLKYPIIHLESDKTSDSETVPTPCEGSTAL